MDKRRMTAAGAAALLLALTAAGCAGADTETVSGDGEVSIPITLIVDSSTGIRNEENVIRAFNQMYDGKWQADVDWIMETEEEYRQKLKAPECDGYASGGDHGSSDASVFLLYDDTGRTDRRAV